MIRHPYGPDELDRTDAELDGIAEQLQDYSAGQGSSPPLDLAARIHAAIDAEPDPAVGWWARVTGSVAGWGTLGRSLTAAAVVTAAIVVAVAVGSLSNGVRQPGSGGSPSPSVVVSPSSSPTVSPSPSPTPSPSPSPTPSASPGPRQSPAPTPSDDAGGGVETPEPSESDHSGPGGGGGDNSGPGGGGSSGSDG